jgi:hypothetical protein
MRLRTLALTGWGFAMALSLLGLLRAVDELANGWVELPLHWWSAGAAMTVVIAAFGFFYVIASTRAQTTSA